MEVVPVPTREGFKALQALAVWRDAHRLARGGRSDITDRRADETGRRQFVAHRRIEADSPAIQTLITTYNDVTGENKTPFTMGGGTYARHFPYAVSFGPEHTDLAIPEFAGPMHGANEGAPFEKLIEALKIYILALLRLQEIEL